MRVYYAEEYTQPRPRLYPYTAAQPSHSGFVDFKAWPERIQEVLEDFIPFSDRTAVQTFYGFLGWLNGPDSFFGSSDSLLKPPGSHNDPNSALALCLHGRVCILYRELKWNTHEQYYNWLCQRLMSVLDKVDPELDQNQGVVGFALNSVLHTGIAEGSWTADGLFDSAENDPGNGKHLVLQFWAYGDSEDEAFANLDRLFLNIWTACRLLNDEIRGSIQGG